MGYWYYDCYIDAVTLRGQKEQEQECLEQMAKRQKNKIVDKPKRWEYDYSDYLWNTSIVNLTPEERKDREDLIKTWKWQTEYDRKKKSEKEQWERKWAWAWNESYIYFISDIDRDLIKIGYSNELPNRFKRLQSDHPNIRLEGVITGKYKDEQEWHKIFGTFRVEGEWFRLLPETLSIIKHLIRRNE